MTDYCPVCGRLVKINADLRLRKHLDGDGERCSGGGLYAPDVTADPAVARLAPAPAPERPGLSARAAAILAAHPDHLRGRTYESIGEEHGMTRERVRQIFAAHGLPHGHELTEYRRRARRLFRGIAQALRHEAALQRMEHNQRHGTTRRYQMGCKCAACTEANTRRSYPGREARGTLSDLICAVCGQAVWKSGVNGALRHYLKTDHAAVAVHRPPVSEADPVYLPLPGRTSRSEPDGD